MLKIIQIIGLAVIAGTISCASFGTKVRMVNPAPLSRLQTVAIWPIIAVPFTDKKDQKSPDYIDQMLEADPGFRGTSERLSKQAEQLLLRELQSRRLFSVIGSDSIITLVSQLDSNFTRFNRTDWAQYSDVIKAEGIIVTGVSFGRESSGINSYVTMTLLDKHTGGVVVEVKFNTKWGKSYLSAQPKEITLPDAIQGAVNGLVNELKKYPAFTESKSAN